MPNEITTTTQGFMSLANNDIAAMMAEELDGLDAGFERIKIPAGGSTMFEVPGEDGEPESVKEFSAVILYHHPLHSYYATKYTGGNQPPNCASFDGVTGEGSPGGACRKCPLNQFGSGENGAKACKNRRRIYVLREGEIFPLLLSLPTGSLQEFTRYIKRLLSRGRKSNAVATRFTLRKATNAGGIAYSQAQFAIDRNLTTEEHALVEKLAEQVKAYARRVGFEDDVPTCDPETGEVAEA
ncbi:MAG: hypothetical protein FWB76_00100 [Oscillospiraceae bacterium]|nr:hypothetical protein [Oscillospiraceae bacterium]